MTKKKVLILTQNFYPVIGSAGNRMKNLFQLLNQNNIEADVLTTEPAYPNKDMYKDAQFWDDETLNQKTKKVVRVPIKNKHFSNRILSRLFFYIEIMVRFIGNLWDLKKEKYDYIYVSTPPIFIVFSAIFAKLFMRSKLILEVRDLWPDSLVGVKAFHYPFIIQFFRFLEKRMYKSAELIVVNSPGFNAHIKKYLNGKSTPIIFLPNGPRKNELVQTKTSTDKFRVVYTGNIGLAQDVSRLKLIANVLNQKKLRFDVIGYGIKTSEFIDYLKENNLNYVHVHEPTTRKKSLALIKESNVAIAFLNNEDVFTTVLPGKVIDYMTCQTPVIAGIKGVAAKLITENNAGYVFEYEDVEGMVEQVIKLKENPQQLIRLGDNCLHTVYHEFLWENNINKLIHAINK